MSLGRSGADRNRFPSQAASEPALDLPVKPKADLLYPVFSSQLQTGLIKPDFSPVICPLHRKGGQRSFWLTSFLLYTAPSSQHDDQLPITMQVSWQCNSSLSWDSTQYSPSPCSSLSFVLHPQQSSGNALHPDRSEEQDCSSEETKESSQEKVQIVESGEFRILRNTSLVMYYLLCSLCRQ